MFIIKLLIVLFYSLLLGFAIMTLHSFFIKTMILFLCIGIFLFIPNKRLIYLSSFLILFPIHLPFITNTSNFIIILLASTLFARSVVHGTSHTHLRRIVRNPFFPVSIVIWLTYLFAFFLALARDEKGMFYHGSFFFSITCAVMFVWLIIAYVTDRDRLNGFFKIFIWVLGLNLVFAVASFKFPVLRNISSRIGMSEVGSVAVGSGEDFAVRLGALNFYWEAYAEYLMAALIFIATYLLNAKHHTTKWTFGIILALAAVTELLLTNTRGAVVVAAIGLWVAIFFFTNYSMTKKTSYLLIFSLITLLSIFIAQKTGFLNLKERFSQFGDLVWTQYGYFPKGREFAWPQAIDQIINDHFIGRGPSFYPLTVYQGGHGNLIWPHNLILLIIATVGIQGLLAYLWCLARVGVLMRRIPKIKDAKARAFFTALWLSFMFILFDEMKFDGFLRSASAYYYFCWSVIALLFSSVHFDVASKTANDHDRLENGLSKNALPNPG